MIVPGAAVIGSVKGWTSGASRCSDDLNHQAQYIRLHQVDVPSARTADTLNCPSGVAWAKATCPVSRVKSATTLPPETAPAPRDGHVTGLVGVEIEIRAARGGTSGV